MSASTATDFGRYKDKMVDLVVRAEDGSEETLQGRVLEGNDFGLFFKRRSQRTGQIVEANNVVSIVEAAGTARLQAIGQKHLRPVVASTVRRHLADYHGRPVSELNTMSNEAAMRLHDEIDHGDLGHDHSAVDESPGKRQVAKDVEREDVLDRIAQLKRAG